LGITVQKFLRSRWLAVAAVSIVAVLGVEGPAMATTGADGFTILHSRSNNLAHSCEVIGTSPNGYQGVICVDLIETYDGASGYEISSELEAFCQKGSTMFQCKSITLYGAWANAAEGNAAPIALGTECGYSGYASCPSPNDRLVAPSDIDMWPSAAEGGSSCGTNAGSDLDQWTLVWANQTLIQTPDGDYLPRPSSNFETGHYYTCY
jgi:hypothetical protein